MEEGYRIIRIAHILVVSLQLPIQTYLLEALLKGQR